MPTILLFIGCATNPFNKVDDDCEYACHLVYESCVETLAAMECETWGLSDSDEARHGACLDDCVAAGEEGRYTERDDWSSCVGDLADGINQDPPDVASCCAIYECGMSPCEDPSYLETSDTWECYP